MTICSNCNLELPDDNGPVRIPCPDCGSTSRDISIAFHDGVQVHERIKMGVGPKIRGRFKWESIFGDDLHRDSGMWRKIKRVFDRLNNRYTEEISDPKTGKIFRKVDEPLTKHVGRGNAKKTNLLD